MAVYFHDTYTGTSGTALTAHVADSGATYPTTTGNDQSGAGFKLDGSGGLFFSTASTTGILVSTTPQPATLNFEVQFPFERVTALTTGTIGVLLASARVLPLNISWMAFFYTESVGFQFQNLGVIVGSAVAGPAAGTKWLIRAVVSSFGGVTTFSSYFSTNLVTPSWSALTATITISTPGYVPYVGPFGACGSTASTATTGVHMYELFVQDITPTTEVLTGPTSGITGSWQEFWVDLQSTAGADACCPTGGEVVTLTSATGGDSFSASIGGATIANGGTLTIPAGNIGQVPFYMLATGSGARNVGISSGNGYALSGSPIAFTPTAGTFTDPTAFPWVPAYTWQPNAPLDPNRIKFNHSDLSTITPNIFNFGFGAPTVTADSSGLTITSTGTSQQAVVLLPGTYDTTNCGTKQWAQMTVGVITGTGGGTLQWGLCLGRSDTGANGNLWLITTGTAAGNIAYRTSNSVAGTLVNLTTGVSAVPSNFTLPGTQIGIACCDNVMTAFYKPLGGQWNAIPGLSGSFVSSTAGGTGTELASYITGCADQRDQGVAPLLQFGVIFFSSVTGNSINISNITTGYWFGGSTRSLFAVRNTFDGSPYADENGNILIGSTTQGPSIDGNHNNPTQYGLHWYTPSTGAMGPRVVQFVSKRNANYTTSQPTAPAIFCGDEDPCILYDDRPGSATYGHFLAIFGTTGDNWQFKQGASAGIYDTYFEIYSDLGALNLTTFPTVVMVSPTKITFPSGVNSPYDFKVMWDNAANLWYGAGICSVSTTYSAAPTSPFIVSGSSITTLTTSIVAPATTIYGNSTGGWDSGNIFRFNGVWYATFVTTTGCICVNLKTGTLVGNMSLMVGLTGGFKFHSMMFWEQFTVNGESFRRPHWASHDTSLAANDFVSFGYKWNQTSGNTWMFGLGVFEHGPIMPGLEHQSMNILAPGLGI